MTFQALDSLTAALIRASLGRLPPLLAALLIMTGVYTPVIIIAAAGAKRQLSSGGLKDIRRSP